MTMPWVDIATEAWAGKPPGFVLAIAAEWDRERSSRKVGAAIGYSPSVVSQLVRNLYPGDTQAIAAAVRDRLQDAVIPCPVQGEISLSACRDWQNRPFSAASALHAAMFRACRVCERNPNREGRQ